MGSPRIPPRLAVATAWLAILFSSLVVLAFQQARVAITAPDARIAGTFPENGHTPHGRPAPAGFAMWSSWAGSDDHRGSLVLGPFPAPARLGLHITGYPHIGNNSLTIRRVDTDEVHTPSVENIGEAWHPVKLDLPEAWRGAPIEIVAIDDAAEWGGWFALSQPYTAPAWAGWAQGFARRLAACAIVTLTVVLLAAGAARILVTSRVLAPHSPLLLPVALALVALVGHLVFGFGMISPTVLNVAAALCLGSAAVAVLWSRPHEARATEASARAPAPQWVWAAAISIIVVLFCFTQIHATALDSNSSDTARVRFLDFQLPSDNAIPQFVAERLIKGEPARTMFGDWHSSDRPPLQTGWILITTPLARAVGIDFDTAAQAASICFQAMALPVMWLLLRTLGAGRFAAALALLAVVSCGVLLINLSFTWPKLGGGALVVLAFLVWFNDGYDLGPARRHLVAGAAAGLGWLSHGGVAFALLAAAPFVLTSLRRYSWRPWLVSTAAFGCLALTWIAYQKFYDPPGNRLLKWHLAGVIPPDSRGTLETLRDSYQALSPAEWWETRRLNVHTLFWGPWRDLVTFSFADAKARRTTEFFQFFYSLGWWNAGWLAFPWVMLRSALDPSHRRLVSSALLWVGGTLLLWSVLMFLPRNTVIHQGSYTTLVVLFPVLAWLLLRAHPLAFGAVAIAQLASFSILWLNPPGAHVLTEPAVVTTVLAVTAGGVLLAAHRADKAEQTARSG